MPRSPFRTMRGLLLLCAAAIAPPLFAADTADTPETKVQRLAARLETLLPVSERSAEAPTIWRAIVDLGPDALPGVLAAMSEDKPVLSNYLRPAVDAIAEKALRDGKKLPLDKLEKFLADKQNPPAARRIAYEWLARVDQTAPTRLLPGMLGDPSPELRRDAVAVVLKEAKDKLANKDETGAKAAYQKALTGACDEDQVRTIVDELKKLGVKVDVAAHYGFVMRWHLATPFDNTDGAGFGKTYPPEMGVDLTASYQGKGGEMLSWKPLTSENAEGVLDLNALLGKKKAVVAYAYAVIDSPVERTVQIRAGSFNAVKMFVNGKQVFARDEYHHGMRLDQHVATATLKKGRNELLLKICQNDQKEDWAQSWSFQARLCDAAGAAVPFTEVKP